MEKKCKGRKKTQLDCVMEEDLKKMWGGEKSDDCNKDYGMKKKGEERAREKREETWLEDGDETLVDLRLLALGDALGNPDNVADLLLTKLEVGVEDAVAHLRLKRQLVQLHLVLKERVLKRLVAGRRAAAKVGKQTPVLRQVAHALTHLVDVCSLGQTRSACRVQCPKVREQLGAVVHRQLRTKRVDRDGDGPPICLKLLQCVFQG